MTTRERGAYQARQANLTGGAVDRFRTSLCFGFPELCLSIRPHAGG